MPLVEPFVPSWAMGLFARDTPEQLAARVAEKWDLTGRLPFPKWEVLCPTCRSPHQKLRYWKFHTYLTAEKTTPYRCDVGFKCRECSYVYIFGVATNREMNEFWGLHNTVTDKEALSGMKPQQSDPREWATYREALGLEAEVVDI